MELLINLRRLERLDKPEYTDDERQEAEEMYEQRRQEELANDVRHYDENKFHGANASPPPPIPVDTFFLGGGG